MPARAGKAFWLAAGVVVLIGIALYGHFEPGRLLTLENLQTSRDALLGAYHAQPALTLLSFFVVYVSAAALSIPGAVILTLAAGAMFDFTVGLLVVSFASSLGALLAFLAARYLLRDRVLSRYGRSLVAINEEVRKDGSFYLLTLRLVPLFPFWLVNLMMGLTPIGAGRFYLVSQIGMLAGTAVYVNAGTQLATIRSTGDILSTGLVASFVLLGSFPLIAKALIAWLRRRRIYANWPRPVRFDRNLVVIGAGAGGLVCSYIAAAVGAKVTLVEGGKMGGDCLNSGCVPSKALIRSARMARQLRNAGALGFTAVSGTVDFAAVMARIRRVIHTIEPHDSVERYTKLGVEVLAGHGRITSPWEVEVTLADGSRRTLTTRSMVIAAGASPAVPAIPGLQEVGLLTSETVWGLGELPRRLLVLGGGPIGCELAQSFARLGSRVTQVEMAPRILGREDPEVAALVAEALREDGVDLLTGHRAVRAEMADGEKRLIVAHGERELVIPFDQLLCAVGRSPRVSGYGLEALGIGLTSSGTIETNAYLQTRYPNILAVGDVAGPFQLTHAAAHQAWYAAVNALFGRFWKLKADLSVMPRATFTDPEAARVGLSETEAREQGLAYEVTRYGIGDLDRAIVDGTTCGFVKVLTAPGKDRILGVTIVGEHAGDLLAEFVLAMRHGLGLNKILATIHTYPTLSEASKYASGEWRRAHAPLRLRRWAGRFHAWARA